MDAEMPVIAHMGLTPQSYNAMGGFKIQGREAAAAHALVQEAKEVEAAGCFAVLLEGVPDVVGRMVTDAVDIPTIGIGAGPDCDGQVLVYHDIIGLENRFKPKFVRRFGSAFDDQLQSVSQYAREVRSGTFPSEAETYVARDELTEALGLYGSRSPIDSRLSMRPRKIHAPAVFEERFPGDPGRTRRTGVVPARGARRRRDRHRPLRR